jgi:hypothetical protein
MATPTSEEAPKSTQVTTAEPVETEERPAITMAGRIGRDPWFSRAEEVLIAGFPLAVNGDQGETTWHNIKARGEVAEAVEAGSDAGHFGTGKQVTVTGVFAEPTGRRKPDFEATSVIKAQPAKKRSPRQPGR